VRARSSLALLLLGAWLLSCVGVSRAPDAPPNVILIFVDTLRADHLGLFGYRRDTSPALDRFAAESLVFRNTTAQAPWTTPSIASALTSRYPWELGYANSRPPAVLSDEFLTLPEIFAANGYRTGAVISHLLIGTKLGFGQGFERFDFANAQGHQHMSSPSIVERAQRFLNSFHDVPFFLFLHFFDPHYAYMLHEPYDYDPDYAGHLDASVDQPELLKKIRSLSDEDIQYIRALYDSEIRFTDEHLGLLLEDLRERGLYENSLIVVAADHGEEFREREALHIGHSSTLYQELIHIPMLIKLPGSAEGRVVDAPVGLIDLAPSIVEALALQVPDGHRFDGRALPLREPDQFSELPEAPIFSETRVRGKYLQSVTLGRWKLIVDHRAERKSLYDLEADPGERNDLAASSPEIVETYTEMLANWTEDVWQKREGLQLRPAELDRDEIEKLRALGYMN
jgi:arylsulfatase A-like enzyme